MSALIAKTNKWLQPNITVKMVPNFLDLTDGDRAVQKVGTAYFLKVAKLGIALFKKPPAV